MLLKFLVAEIFEGMLIDNISIKIIIWNIFLEGLIYRKTPNLKIMFFTDLNELLGGQKKFHKR